MGNKRRTTAGEQERENTSKKAVGQQSHGSLGGRVQRCWVKPLAVKKVKVPSCNIFPQSGHS